ncbi:zinc finger, CCHC-type containing protein [Tanacetum coccineum]|uniref:Zinc finger, CCHC-type containing protein n=1 Tax=Tanacetum coccineum TaxID=301880 RepID=A0ABQ5EBU4_9ASTR
MPPRRTRNINDVYERIMARMEERLDQFVDQFSNRMNDMMNLRRCKDRNGRRSEDGELGNPFFEGDCSSSNEWGDYGVVGDDYEGAPVFDDDYEEAPVFNDDQFEEESMPVYDTDIEDVIEEEEGFVGKEGFIEDAMAEKDAFLLTSVEGGLCVDNTDARIVGRCNSGSNKDKGKDWEIRVLDSLEIQVHGRGFFCKKFPCTSFQRDCRSGKKNNANACGFGKGVLRTNPKTSLIIAGGKIWCTNSCLVKIVVCIKTFETSGKTGSVLMTWVMNTVALIMERKRSIRNLVLRKKLYTCLMCLYVQNFLPDDSDSVYMSSSTVVNSSLWHARLGHVHYKRMLEMSKDELIPAIDEILINVFAMFTATSKDEALALFMKLQLLHNNPRKNGVADRKIELLRIKRMQYVDEEPFLFNTRPKDIIPNVQESQMDDHTDDVPNEIPEPRRGKRAKKAKSYGSDFSYNIKKEAIDDEDLGFYYENIHGFYLTYPLVANL